MHSHRGARRRAVPPQARLLGAAVLLLLLRPAGPAQRHQQARVQRVQSAPHLLQQRSSRLQRSRACELLAGTSGAQLPCSAARLPTLRAAGAAQQLGPAPAAEVSCKAAVPAAAVRLQQQRQR